MARSNESAIKRLQVGLVGLIVVLLFVSVASMILDGAKDPSDGKSVSEEPLVELGVTPVVQEQPEKQTTPQPPASGTPQN